MLKDIGTWVVRKGIWFLIILIGCIAYWNLHPYWEEIKKEAKDAELVVTTQQAILEELSTLQTDSNKTIEAAQSELTALLDQRIDKEIHEIQELTSKRDSVSGFGISKIIIVKYLDFKLDFASWRKNEFIRIRNERLNEAQRQTQIANTRENLKRQNDAYSQLWAKHQKIMTGVNTGSNTLDNASSKLISKANQLMAWSDFEIRDANASHKLLVRINNEITVLQSELDQLLQPKKSLANPMPSAEKFKDEIAGLVKKAADAYERSWLHKRIVQPASEYWLTALAAVILAMILSPLARLICFYLLAPMAAKQSPIRIEPESNAEVIPNEGLASESGVSIRINPGEVLLAHHEYMKAIPKQCVAHTQALLDRASMLTSALSGLYNLARIESTAPVNIELSAGHDGLNELICIELPVGSGLVIEPRNLVGVVAKQGHSIHLKKHWSLGKLQSWLKWQFRHITISGPLTVILKGGRGLVVTPIHDELMIAPDYVVAFSSNLAFGTSRTETFAGYYSRKKSLLNDRFSGNRGLVIHQEANLGSGTSRVQKSGLEGIMDGVLKAFGI